MNCIEKGILRAQLDGELHGRELEEVNRHLADCGACRRELEAITSEAGQVKCALEALAPAPGEMALDPVAALARFRAEGAPAERLSVAQRIFARRWAPAWGAALAAGLIALSISFAPARSWAQKILAMLRVQQITVVSVEPILPSPEAQDRAAKMLSQLISDNVVFTMQPGKPQETASREQASQMAGFPVRLVSARQDAPHLSVEGEQAFHMTLNRDRLQAIVDEAGRSDVQLPASIDGAEVAVHIPKLVVARYGDLPAAKGNAQPPDNRSSAPSQADLKNFLLLAQVPSPTVSVPPNLNIAQVAEAGLELAGMTPADAQTFVQSIDWTSTLVIPVPREGGSYQKQIVDGVEGELITMPQQRRRPAGYTLIWVKNGIIYSLAGFSDPAEVVAMADSLQ